MMRTRGVSLVLSLALLPAFTTPRIVASEPAPELPDVTASSWVLYDATAGVTLASHNADRERPMASTTKIMTALVVMENAALDETVRVSARAAGVGESEIGLVTGEVWTVEDLLAAMLVRSGNDAAMALAEHVGGSIRGFAEMMNAKAEQLGLEHSSFANPHGLDANDHYTTANDLRVIAEAALKFPYIAELGRTRRVEFKPAPNGTERVAITTNRLLGVYPAVVGLKTGFTSRAGLCLVAVAQQDGRTLISVVLRSRDHFRDSRALLDYGLRTASLRDHFVAPLLSGEGDGTPTRPPGSFGDLERARLAAVRPLPTGDWATTEFRATGLGKAIEAWIRSVVPVTLGGGG